MQSVLGLYDYTKALMEYIYKFMFFDAHRKAQAKIQYFCHNIYTMLIPAIICAYLLCDYVINRNKSEMNFIYV